jgi:plastocyanin
MLSSSFIAIMLAAVVVLVPLTSIMSVTYAQYGGTGGSVGTASPEQLQECEQLGIPPENCNDVTILAKERLNAAQLETGDNNGSDGSIVVTNVTSISNVTTTFQSNVDGFRVQVPSGWLVMDTDNTDPRMQQQEKTVEFGQLAMLCPQTETLPMIGGGHRCSDGAGDSVMIIRFADLQSRPEFAVLARENKSITTSDLLAYFIQFFENNYNARNFRLSQDIDKVVNVTDLQTNQTIATAPAKYVEVTYSVGIQSLDAISLLVLSNDGNTGYALIPAASFLTTAGELPPEYPQIFDSFELLQPISGSTDSGESTLTILEGSSIQGSPDYDPDELTVPAGSDVNIVNQDIVPHTVTSGISPLDPNSAQLFDTSLINGGESVTLSLAQVAAGQYDYYCMVHPYMTGKLTIVAATYR